MYENLLISVLGGFNLFKIKRLQTIAAIVTVDKVTEFLCISDDFYKVYEDQMEKCGIKMNFGNVLA